MASASEVPKTGQVTEKLTCDAVAVKSTNLSESSMSGFVGMGRSVGGAREVRNAPQDGNLTYGCYKTMICAGRRTMNNLALLLLLVLTGCSTSYEGGILSNSSTGYTQIDDRTIVIKSRGNAFANAGRIGDFQYLKAAELTIRLGHSHFAIIGTADKSTIGADSTSIYTKPGEDMTIRLLDAGEFREGQANIHDARSVITHLAPVYSPELLSLLD